MNFESTDCSHIITRCYPKSRHCAYEQSLSASGGSASSGTVQKDNRNYDDANVGMAL